MSCFFKGRNPKYPWVTGVIVDKLVAPISRQISYLLYYKSNIDDLRRKHEDLRDVRESVQRRVNEATNNCEIILPNVDAFLTNVDTFTKERSVVDLLDEQKVTKGYCCLSGNCPNLKLRHKLSRKATKSSSVADSLKEEGNAILTYPNVSSHAPPPKNTSTSIRDGEEFESRKLIFKEIMDAIKDDEMKMIGIYGMGGVGKTTLIKQVATKAKADNLFDDIAMAVVSQNPDLREIQSQIGDRLGLKFIEESLQGRAERLMERLKKKRSLIILDDIWRNLKLEDIGIPFDCKLVLTSRSHDVCSQMGTQKNFLVKVLNEIEAWNLFRKMTGGDSEYGGLPSQAAEITKECAGLPIAIVTVARALKGKSLSVWRDTLIRQQRNSNPVDLVFENIKMSYDFLKSETKQIFLLCCLFPEDFEIPLERLMVYGMGLDLFKDVVSLEEARDRTYTLADNLMYSCLLQEVEGDSHHIKMHDVVRDVAIRIASQGEGDNVFLVLAGEQWKEWQPRFEPPPYTAITITSNSSIHKLPDGLVCPKLQLLQLECSHPSLDFPENFFSNMTHLRVLTLSDLKFSSLPPSLGHLKNLRTLCVNYCKRLKDISIIGELERLEYLSFVESNIAELPASIGRLTHLRLLNLRGWGKGLLIFRPHVIPRLSDLEGLYLPRSHSFDEADYDETSARLAELTQLSRLRTIELWIHDAKVLPEEDLLFKNLLRYLICIGDINMAPDLPFYFEYWVGGRLPVKYSRTLLLFNKTSITFLNNGIMGLLKGVEKLELSQMDVASVLHDGSISEGFPNLKSLQVTYCEEVEFIYNATSLFSRVAAFPVLHELVLLNLPKLKEICHGPPPIGFFSQLQVLELRGLPQLINMWKENNPHMHLPKLRNIAVGYCSSLKTLFPHSMARDLPQLVSLSVEGCNLMRQVVENGNENEEGVIEDHIEFPKLRYLELWWLPNLDSFCSKIKVSFPNLESLVIDYTKLTHVFSPSTARGLAKLKKLTIENCGLMEEVIMEEGEGRVKEVEKIELPSLQILKLIRLPNLRMFCQGSYSLLLTSLEYLMVTECPLMENFSCGIVSTPNLNEVKQLGNAIWKGDINNTIQYIFNTRNPWESSTQQGLPKNQRATNVMQHHQ